MDGSSGYNQIFMAEEDKLHITFRTPKGIYCYKVMPFGLKNAGATVKKVMTHIFDDLLHKHVECYVNDFVVKSKRREDHLADLRIVFEGFRKYNLKMNPLKCVFGVSSGFAWDTAMAGRSDEYAVNACVQESSGEHPGWSESKTVTKQGGQPIVQPTSRAKYEDKMTGGYERYTAKEKVSSGQQFVERSTGRVGFKDVQQRSSTVKIGDKSGYTE